MRAVGRAGLRAVGRAAVRPLGVVRIGGDVFSCAVHSAQIKRTRPMLETRNLAAKEKEGC